MTTILKAPTEPAFAGCDFVLQLGEERKGTKIRLLQLTDMQFIDSKQQRTPDRLRWDETAAWLPENLEVEAGNHIRSLITQTHPDLIFITGDMVYGSFDDAGTTMEWFCGLMDSFQIPWAPVFGNHDNECARGVAWQCQRLEESAYCMFRRGTVSGNGNYTVGIATGEELVRVLHMIDSNGCWAATDPEVIREYGIFEDQIELLTANTKEIEKGQGRAVPAFAAFHVPTKEFVDAETSKGYRKDDREFYTIGVDVPDQDGDFGCKQEKISPICTEYDFLKAMKDNHVEGVFAGHYHCNNTCIRYEDMMWVFGLKTGQYDYHLVGQLGGTLVTLEGDTFAISHVPALVTYGPYPGQAPMFRNLFAKEEENEGVI